MTPQQHRLAHSYSVMQWQSSAGTAMSEFATGCSAKDPNGVPCGLVRAWRLIAGQLQYKKKGTADTKMPERRKGSAS